MDGVGLEGQGAAVEATRGQVLRFRARAQQLDRGEGGIDDTAVLDLGVQDTGPDGALWALAVRGVDVSVLAGDELATVWSIRGAPHAYRRAELPSVAAAVAPLSDNDAGSRIFDAAKPLNRAGIGTIAALDAVAAAMASVVTAPTVKGVVSGCLTPLLDPPYLRFCSACNAAHVHEQLFRLAALRAGLELAAGTSPPVLQPIPGFRPAEAPLPRHDVVPGYLRLLGPATPRHVAAYLDAPIPDVKAHWPADTVVVSVDGEPRGLLAADAELLEAVRHPSAGPPVARLLGPYDLFLQARDRSLLVPDPARAKALWPVLGRPGAVLLDGQVAGTWRPRQTGKRLTLLLQPWTDTALRTAVAEAAERLAHHRDVTLTGFDEDG